MNPTPAELALIAIALSKSNGTTPQESLVDAHSFWMDACLHLAGEAARQADRKAEMRKPKIETLLSFDDFLKTKMPKLSKSYRRKQFYQFLLTFYVPKGVSEPLPESSITKLALRFYELCKKDGASAGGYPEFANWYKAKIASARSDSAKVMHKKRKADEKAKAIDRNANREATEKKSRLTFLPPEKLAIIAEKEYQAGGGSLQD